MHEKAFAISSSPWIRLLLPWRNQVFPGIRHKKQKGSIYKGTSFSQLSADEKSLKTGFPFGTKLYYIQRLRYLDGIPLILDHNYFSMEQVKDLTPEIARNSVYDYLENDLGISISTSKRTITVERMTQADETYLDLKDYTCLAVITNQTFDDNGIQFEYTQSRHRPDYFQFQDIAVRKKVEPPGFFRTAPAFSTFFL